MISEMPLGKREESSGRALDEVVIRLLQNGRLKMAALLLSQVWPLEV